jgi:hypothetical protein
MSCCRFPSFPVGSLVAFWDPKNCQAALLLLTNHIVQYKSNSMITRTLGYYEFLPCTQRTFCSKPRGITLIESTQIRWFLRWSGRGGWSGRAIAQWRPRVSKLGLKGPSDYYSNEIAVEAAAWRGPLGWVKGYSHRESSQGESWITALNLFELGQKAACNKYTSLLIRKSYSLFLGVTVKKGVADDDDDVDEWEPVEPITSPHDNISGYWGFSSQKPI